MNLKVGGSSGIDFPLRHISIRVPWHDSGWVGTICAAPQLNSSCVKLKGISERKNDAVEIAVAGRSLDDLSPEQWPCCIDERATFMAPFEMQQTRRHALAERSPEHYGHFKPTPQRFPAYSAGVVPFLWMMRPQMEHYQELLGLKVDAGREPDVGYETNWVHEAENQTALLDGFAAHLRPESSLCLFYAKHVPFVEGTSRILVGAGRVKSIGGLTEYVRAGSGMRGIVWERPVQHSIRPKGKDGFLMPYLELLQRSQEDSSLDLESLAARVPDDHWTEFSFGSELVTHDGAIAALLVMDAALGRIEAATGIVSGWQRQWLHDELVRLWKVRGPFPGLGATLAAFGLSRGIFVAHALQQRAGDNADPWQLVDAAFRDPASVLPAELRRDLKELASTWTGLHDERRRYLRLLSRFEISVDQARALYDEGTRAKNGRAGSDSDLLRNPYQIFETSRHDVDGLRLLTIDRGVFPEDSVRNLHPLEEPSYLESAVDLRRVRAFTVHILEQAAAAGNTLLDQPSIVEAARNIGAKPECPITTDILSTRALAMAPEVIGVDSGINASLQLHRYHAIGEFVRKQVMGRVEGQRHLVDENWLRLLREHLPRPTTDTEKRAIEEKAAALAELSQSRFSVLVGPAGSGKTTVLGVLCALDVIRSDGILLLAPTGKARVRMQQLAGAVGAGAQTIAQFLNQNGRYDGKSGRYHMSDRPKATGFGTVIIDEASMLTEDMLGALLDSLQGVKRFILVGDPAQLPPIGAGRPFADIINKLRPSQNGKAAPGYAELTIEMRQIGVDRPDLRFARWFGTGSPSPGEDDIFSADDQEHEEIRFVRWDKPEDLHTTLSRVLAEELQLSGVDDVRGFNRSLGATLVGEYDYFNATRDKKGAVDLVESWQILSPLRGMAYGVTGINRQIHERFRGAMLEFAERPKGRSIPRPVGAERIVYGDKVINLSNHRRDGRRVYPQEGALGYLANGEVGVVVGQWKSNSYPKITKVEFSSQKGYTYDFYRSDFREEGEAALELAYALTVHKAQGSQFGLVVLVLPEGHPILSRELIYTALTRHQNRVVILHQGQRSVLKEFTAPHRSETARRRTNLLEPCRMVEFPQPKASVFLQQGLIHRTSRGLAVRSKSELLIAEALVQSDLPFEYEKPLTLGGKTRFPDFTIEDEISGRVIYWEHLGLLEREDYRRSWERKLRWYTDNQVGLFAGKFDSSPMLVTTTESSTNGLDMSAVTSITGLLSGKVS